MFSHSVRRKRLLTLRDTQYAPIHPSKQEKSWIIYLCSCVWEKWMRNMWQAVGWERDTTGLFNTNTRACWEITGECSFRDTNTVESASPPFIGFSSPFRMCLGATSLGPRRVLTTSWSWLPQSVCLSLEQKHQIAAYSEQTLTDLLI